MCVRDRILKVGLREAAKRDIGSGANQVPDMNLFSNAFNGVSGYCYLPNGVIIQCAGISGFQQADRLKWRIQ
ncbi:hypothetical protein A6J71_01100 [Enterobacter cancerogenus]|nr:hypothetical protein A6J71_01100 [Enterobacter cancerogenus]